MVSRQLLRPVITDVIYKDMHFIIMDSPTKDTAENFAQECANLHVSDLIRVCEDKYPTVAFEKRGISVHHWEFDDGSPPPESILDQWFELLRLRFYNSGTNNHHKDHSVPDGDKRNTVPSPVAVHCLAGYGRAPVLVAVALLELGMANQDAIELIRSTFVTFQTQRRFQRSSTGVPGQLPRSRPPSTGRAPLPDSLSSEHLLSVRRVTTPHSPARCPRHLQLPKRRVAVC